MHIEEKVIDTIRRYAVIDKAAAIEKSHNLRDDLGLDSLDLCELTIELEKIFDTSIPDELIWEIVDVQGVIDAVEDALTAFINKKL